MKTDLRIRLEMNASPCVLPPLEFNPDSLVLFKGSRPTVELSAEDHAKALEAFRSAVLEVSNSNEGGRHED